MKVSDIPSKNLLQHVDPTQSSNPPEKNQKPEEALGKTESGDRVELSSRSRELQKIHEVLQSTPEVRLERVSELKKRIAEGRYHLESNALAEKILKESLLDLIK